MTESEAKVILESEYKFHGECSIFGEALTIAIKALEKQMPKKPLKDYVLPELDFCPSCGCEVTRCDYCPICGQRID